MFRNLVGTSLKVFSVLRQLVRRFRLGCHVIKWDISISIIRAETMSPFDSARNATRYYQADKRRCRGQELWWRNAACLDK